VAHATLVLVLVAAVVCAKPIDTHSGFLADLTSVAEGNAHHGYDTGAEAAELWSLGSPTAADAALVGGRGESMQQLQSENTRAGAQGVVAHSFKDTTKREGTAISLALNRKLAVLPESQECMCAHEGGGGWDVVTAARAQVLKEEGEGSASDLKKDADECPCRSALVGAVTQVLQEKLEKLTQELGSSTSAALALQRALVSMRLPDELAGELTKELDQSLAKKARKKTGVTKAKKEKAAPSKEAEPAADAEDKEPEAINIIVNNNMGDSSYNVTFSDVVNQSLPYFYAYKYPPAYIAGGQAPFATPAPYAWEGGKESPPMNVIVNVNNYIMPKNDDPWGIPCSTARCFQMRASGKIQLHAASQTQAAAHNVKNRTPATAAAERAAAPMVTKRSAQVVAKQRALAKKLASAVDALQDIGCRAISTLSHAAQNQPNTLPRKSPWMSSASALLTLLARSRVSLAAKPQQSANSVDAHTRAHLQARAHTHSMRRLT